MDRDRDVELLEKATQFQGYFRIDRYRLRHRLFGGGWGRPIVREVFERGHSVAVLPYDPGRDEVVLIEQFRMGPYAAGAEPWLLEIVAGIVEDGENAEEVARREAVEEAGCHIAEIVPVGGFYVSPGGTSEYVRILCGRVDASKAGGVHGLASEGEDIRVVVLAFRDALAALDGGRVESSSAFAALQWLALHRDDLRRRWR